MQQAELTVVKGRLQEIENESVQELKRWEETEREIKSILDKQNVNLFLFFFF